MRLVSSFKGHDYLVQDVRKYCRSPMYEQEWKFSTLEPGPPMFTAMRYNLSYRVVK